MKMKVHVAVDPVMTISRKILKKDKLVYLFVGPRPIRYQDGRSKIVYIGTTRKGISRIAGSAAHRADVLERPGFRRLEVYIVSCSATPGLKSWQYLERALLARFRGRYFQLPVCNQQGKSLRWTKKLAKKFKAETIDKVLAQFDPSQK